MNGTQVTVSIPVTLYNELRADSKHGRLQELDKKYADRKGIDDVTLWCIQACAEKAAADGYVEGVDEDSDVYVTIGGDVEEFEGRERDSSGKFA
jgi:hypothetical protein